LVAAFFPQAGRHSALASLVVGCGVGLVLFNADDRLPVYITQAQCRPIWLMGVALATMVIWSLIENTVKGRIP
tara:strand:+ start:209 stop:427 length:219 start_codon:yes stop_codon:yes gene_type:complete